MTSLKVPPVPPLPYSPTAHLLALLHQNHVEKHIYFKSGFHNHFPHTATALAALGASDARLDAQWENDRKVLEAVRSIDRSVVIDGASWGVDENLGRKELYPNYLAFFSREIETTPLDRLISHPAIFPRLFSGLLHPLIHLAYGAELENNKVNAEGLAMACVNAPALDAKIIDLLSNESGNGDGNILSVLNTIYTDSTWDFLTPQQSRSDRIQAITSHLALLKPHLTALSFPPHNTQRALNELSLATALLVTSTGFLEDGTPSLDFLMCHLLTATFAIHQLLPHCTESTARSLIRAMQFEVLVNYIERGRPAITPERLPQGMSWDKVVDAALQPKSTDWHLPKSVRALRYFTTLVGSEEEREVLRKGASAIVTELSGKRDPKVGIQSGWRYDARGFVERGRI